MWCAFIRKKISLEMARREDNPAGTDTLERALYAVDENVICDYFQRGELWSSNVSPVLLAVATLQAMLKSSPVAHYHCSSDTVQLLEYIHSQSSDPGIEKRYIDLLVDFKTKAVLYELFQEVELTERFKEDVLTKYFGRPSLQGEREDTTNTTAEEYSCHLHSFARHGLEKMLATNQQCLEARRTDLFNSDNSRTINETMLSDLSCYLTAVCRHMLPSPMPTQTASVSRGGEAATASCENTPESDVCINTESVSGRVQYLPNTPIHQQQASSGTSSGNRKGVSSKEGGDQHVLYGSKLKSRGKRTDKSVQNTYAADITSNTSSAEEATVTTQLDKHRVHYNLRRQRGRDRTEEDGDGGKSPTVKVGLTNDASEQEYCVESDRDSGSDITDTAAVVVKRSLKPTRYSLSPHGQVHSRSTGRVDNNVPSYATPSRLSRRLLMKKNQEDNEIQRFRSNPNLLTQQGVALTTRTRQEGRSRGSKTGGGDVTLLPVEGRRYDLRQRRKSSYESETTGTSEMEDMMRNIGLRGRATGGKRKRSESSDLSESSEYVPPSAMGRQQSSATRSPWRQGPRPKRSVKFRESPNNSADKNNLSSLTTQKKTSTRTSKIRQGRECSGDSRINSVNSSPHSTNRRKQGNPRKLLQSPREVKVASKVHFSQGNVQRNGATRSDCSPRNQNTAKERSNSPVERKRLSATRSPHRAMIRSSDSSSDSETSRRVVSKMHLRSRRPRHQVHYTSTARSPARHVVNLASNSVEQSHPNRQWDYVTVQNITAAAATNRSLLCRATAGHCGSPASLKRPCTPPRVTSDIDSDHERTSIVTCSSDEFAMSSQAQQPYRGGDKLSIVSESSPGALSPSLQPPVQPALHSIHRLRKRAH